MSNHCRRTEPTFGITALFHCTNLRWSEVWDLDVGSEQRALARTFGSEPVLIREGGSIPIVQTFRDILEADTLLLGLALPDAQIHAPNENFPIANFEAGIRLNQALLKELAN